MAFQISICGLAKNMGYKIRGEEEIKRFTRRFIINTDDGIYDFRKCILLIMKNYDNLKI